MQEPNSEAVNALNQTEGVNLNEETDAAAKPANPNAVSGGAVANQEPQFPAEIPWQSALALVDLIRSGDLLANRLKALQLASWIVGCTATAIEDRRDDNDVVVAARGELQTSIVASQALSLENCASEIERLATETQVTSDVDAKLNPAIIAIIIQVIRLFSQLKQ